MSEPRRRCTTCSEYAVETARGKWTCPEDRDHPLKWSARADMNLPGAPRKRLRKTFETRKEADDWLAQVRLKRKTGSIVEPSKLTFGDYLDSRWIPYIEDSGLRESTVASYVDVLKHARPTLDPLPLQSITADLLSRLYAEIGKTGGRSRQGLAPKTVRYCASVVGKALKDAKRWKLIQHNPALEADVPSLKAAKSRAAEEEAWSADQVADFFEHVADDRLKPLWWFLAATGVRRGEALGLQWSNTGLEGGTVSIVVSRGTVNHKVVETAPKTARSRRRIALDPTTVQVLKAWRQRQLEERMRFGESWVDTGHVFTREDGKPWHPDWVSKLFESAVKKSGLPRIPLKGLRHTSATVALEAGVHPKVVQERLGHSSIAITLDTYSHVAEGMDREAAERIAQRMGGG